MAGTEEPGPVSRARVFLAVVIVLFLCVLYREGWSSLSVSSIMTDMPAVLASRLHASHGNRTLGRPLHGVLTNRTAASHTGCQPRPGVQPAMPPTKTPTLVIYAFHADKGSEHWSNARLFVRLAAQAGDGAHIAILLPHGHLTDVATRRARYGALPPGSRWLRLPKGACNASTWGMVGAGLGLLGSNVSSYKHIVVADSFVSGPFVPAHVRQHMHWTSVFTDLLQQPGVRLAGSMISCEVAAQGGDLSGARRTNPHVLPHAWATDAATLRALRDAGAFKCRADPWETRWHSDLGASKTVLDAGGNLASLLGPQRGVDWRNRTNWHCNGRVAPDRQGTYDGLTVSPYEAVFWPIGLAQAENYAALRVGGRYATWSMGSSNLKLNRYHGRAEAVPQVLELEWSERGEVSLELRHAKGGDACFDHGFYTQDKRMAELRASCFMDACGFSMFDHYMLVGIFEGRAARWVCPPPELKRLDAQRLLVERGRACFDHAHYRASSAPELDALGSAAALWEHWVLHGQFEGRAGRYLCDPTAQVGLRRGVDGTPAELLRQEQRLLMARVKRGDSAVLSGGVAGAADVQAGLAAATTLATAGAAQAAGSVDGVAQATGEQASVAQAVGQQAAQTQAQAAQTAAQAAQTAARAAGAIDKPSSAAAGVQQAAAARQGAGTADVANLKTVAMVVRDQ